MGLGASHRRVPRRVPGQERFPHVYGAIPVDAVFDAVPLETGSDGRFRPHEEASAFAATQDATLGDALARASRAMEGFEESWWIAGGWAIDAFPGRMTRPHADLEISILRRNA